MNTDFLTNFLNCIKIILWKLTNLLKIDQSFYTYIPFLEQALWFYGLLSIVEKPLHPDDQSCLRSFVIVCSKQRRAIIEASLGKDSADEVEKSISHLNLIICLVAKYFGQADLADDNSINK